MSVMSEIQRRVTPSRRGWPGSEKAVLWGLTLLIGILSIAPLTAQIERSLDEAAQIFGAGFLRRMRDILMPLAAPSAMAGTILVFLTALNEIQVSILLVTSGTQTLGPMIVFLDEGGSSTLAAAVGCLMIVVVLGFMLLASLFARRLPEGVLPWRI